MDSSPSCIQEAKRQRCELSTSAPDRFRRGLDAAGDAHTSSDGSKNAGSEAGSHADNEASSSNSNSASNSGSSAATEMRIGLEDVKNSKELQDDRAAILQLIRQNDDDNSSNSSNSNNSSTSSSSSCFSSSSSSSLPSAALRLASSRLRSDKELVLEAVRQDGLALRFASAELRRDEEVVIEAVQQHGGAIHFASGGVLRDNKDIALLACRRIYDTSDWWCLLDNEQADVDSEMIAASQVTAIAVRGERAPVLTVTLWQAFAKDAASASAKRQFTCEARLLSGATFTCELGHEDERDGDGDGDGAAGAVEAVEAAGAVRGEGESEGRGKGSAAVGDVDFGNEDEGVGAAGAVGAVGDVVVGGGAAVVSDAVVDSAGDENRAASVGGGAVVDEGAKGEEAQWEWGCARSGPTLGDLAAKLVQELPKHSEVKDATSIFINFLVSQAGAVDGDGVDDEADTQNNEDDEEDGFAVPISPWDWWRPLTEFLPGALRLRGSLVRS